MLTPKDSANRRDFLKAGTAVVATGVWSELRAAESTSPNEKLNLAAVGVAGRAAANLAGCKSQNFVGLCDVDDRRLGKAGERLPQARKYNDFRKMFDQLDHQIDAVIVATPDHIHAPASVMAMKMGKHCYCEKPLTHTVAEARTMAQIAAQKGLATQMGTQIHAGNNYRRVVEIIRSGAIGPVREVHVWVGKGWGGGKRPTDKPPVPSHLHWDLWLGPAPYRPYHRTYLPAQWRRWWDFGEGTLGDMACHYMDLPFWALDLRYPDTIEAEGPPVDPETCPTGLIVRYEHPSRGDRPPVKLTWYDGNRAPGVVAGHKVRGSGVMFVGAKGEMFADYGGYQLYPKAKFANFEPPPQSIPNSIGHHAEWIKACKEGTPTTCNFDYSGALTEAVLLGNVAYRTGKKIEWDAKNLKVTNCPEAAQYLSYKYRSGWTF
jgi:predicted dehydrogenase